MGVRIIKNDLPSANGPAEASPGQARVWSLELVKHADPGVEWNGARMK